ncbi:flagellar basal body L-ring protein FlgH [soil metagenome]
MKRILVALPLALVLAGCQGDKPGTPGSPPLSLVGQGLSVNRAPLPAAFAEPDVRSQGSLWGNHNQGLFRDLRARKVGDVVTVSIDINDQAQFDNATGHSKQAAAKGGFSADLGFEGFSIPEQSGKIGGNFDSSGTMSAKGEGTIDRSEKLHLSIAAVVTEVLPDGNLLVSGSQEVRVNHEVRVLTIAGIVRSLDIASNNSISYDKIAEARISYGGRGNISAMQ